MKLSREEFDKVDFPEGIPVIYKDFVQFITWGVKTFGSQEVEKSFSILPSQEITHAHLSECKVLISSIRDPGKHLLLNDPVEIPNLLYVSNADKAYYEGILTHNPPSSCFNYFLNQDPASADLREIQKYYDYPILQTLEINFLKLCEVRCNSTSTDVFISNESF